MEFQSQFLQFVQNKSTTGSETKTRSSKPSVESSVLSSGIKTAQDTTKLSAKKDEEGELNSSFEEEMPQIDREAWSEEEVKGMPVLQRMVDQSPPPSLDKQTEALVKKLLFQQYNASF